MPKLQRNHQWADVTVDLAARTVERAGRPLTLEPRVFALLEVLLDQAGQAVSRDELFSRVWNRRVVNDEALTQAVTRLRRELGPNAGAAIETVRGHGYRFCATTQPSPSATAGANVSRLWLAGGLAGLLGVVLVTIFLLTERSALGDPDRLAVLRFSTTGEAADWIGMGLSSLVAEAIPARHRVEVVGPESASDPGQPARDLGADWVLGAGVERAGDAWRVAYTLHHHGDLVWEQTLEGARLRGVIEDLNRALVDVLDAPRRDGRTPLRLSSVDFVNVLLARARHARHLGDYPQAGELLRLALRDDPGLLVAQSELADVLRHLGEYDEAQRLADRVRDAAREIGDNALAGDARTTLGLIAWRRGDYDTGIREVADALTLHTAAERPADVARDHNILGVLRGRRGDTAVAFEHHLQALAIYRRIGDRAGESRTHNNISYLAYNSGDIRTAIEHDERALAIQTELGMDSDRALTLNGLASNLLYSGRFARAAELYAESLALRERLGDRPGVVTTRGNLGLVHARRGDHATARSLVETARDEAIELGSPELEAHAWTKLGDISLRAGDVSAARRAFDAAEAIWRSLDLPGQITDIALWRIELALADGDTAGARTALAALDTETDPAVRARVELLRSRLLRDTGDPEPALARARSALEAGRRSGGSQVVVDAAITGAHACMDAGHECAGEFLAHTTDWQAEYVPAIVAQARWLHGRGDTTTARAELARARELAGAAWKPEYERLAAAAAGEAGP